jgi:hypothetical protein
MQRGRPGIPWNNPMQRGCLGIPWNNPMQRGCPEFRGTTPCKGQRRNSVEQPHATVHSQEEQRRGCGEIRKITPCSPADEGRRESKRRGTTPGLGPTGPGRPWPGAARCAPQAGRGSSGVSKKSEINPMQSNATVNFRLSPHKDVCGSGAPRRASASFAFVGKIGLQREVGAARYRLAQHRMGPKPRPWHSPCGAPAMAPREVAMYIRCGANRRTAPVPPRLRVR